MTSAKKKPNLGDVIDSDKYGTDWVPNLDLVTRKSNILNKGLNDILGNGNSKCKGPEVGKV